MIKPRLVFMGTPAFALPTLQALYSDRYQIVGVYTQPPRAKGRGHTLQYSPIHQWSMTQGLPIFMPQTLRDQDALLKMAALQAEVAIVVAYGLILPGAVLDLFPKGCLNVHASLLPRWRGAAPIQRAIAAGDTTTGITIMQMEPGLDTGPMLAQQKVPITNHTTGQSLHDTLALVGADLLRDMLPQWLAQRLSPQQQDDTQATYAAKLTKQESYVDWRQSATVLDRQIRAFAPWPGSQCRHGEMALKILEAEVIATSPTQRPGTVLDKTLTVQCGDGALRLTRLQKPGGAPLSAAEFLRGYPLRPGDHLF